MAATALDTHVFWITSRAAGSLALILASLSVGFGLLMAGKLVRGRGPDLRVVHEALALGTIGALVVHAGALVFDGFVGMSALDVTVPFLSGYHRFWTTLGIMGGWAIVLLGLSFYLRDRIGRGRWKLLHRFTAVGWLAGAGHALGEGTDAGTWWFLPRWPSSSARRSRCSPRAGPPRSLSELSAPAEPPTTHPGDDRTMPPASTPPPTPEARRAAVTERARLRRERTRRLRRRIAAGAVSAFVALFATISIQMATGHDPVLAARSTSTQATTAQAATGSDDDTTSSGTSAPLVTSSSGTSSSSTGTSASTQSSGSTSSAPAAVTTQQS